MRDPERTHQDPIMLGLLPCVGLDESGHFLFKAIAFHQFCFDEGSASDWHASFKNVKWRSSVQDSYRYLASRFTFPLSENQSIFFLIVSTPRGNGKDLLPLCLALEPPFFQIHSRRHNMHFGHFILNGANLVIQKI